MFLRSITVKNFKKFPELTVRFPADITIIRGPNEQGKSTLLSAIVAGLFYDPKKSNKDITALRAWNSEKLYEIALDIEHHGEDISVRKDFEKKELALKNTTTGETMTTAAAVAGYLYTIGALRSAALFENTACVKHDALARITEGKREIAQALEELMTSSGENVSADKILKKIGDIIAGLQRGIRGQAKTPGLLKQIDSDIAELTAKKEAIARELNDIGEKSRYCGELTAHYHAIVRELEIQRSQYRGNNDYFKTAEEVKKLHAQLEKVEADSTALKDIESKQEYLSFQLEKFKHVQAFDQAKWYAQREALSVKKAQLAHFNAEAKQTKNGGEKKSKTHIKKAHFLAALVLAAAGFLGFAYTPLFALWGLCAAAVVYSFVLKHGLVVHTPAVARTEASTLLHEIAVLEKQRDQILSESGVHNEDALLGVIKKVSEQAQEFAKLSSKREGILRERTLEDFTKERKELLRRIGIEEAKITDEQKASSPSGEVQRALELDIAKNEQDLSKLEKEIVRTEEVMRATPYDHEMLSKAEEDLEWKQQQRANAEYKLKTLEALYVALGEAKTKTIEKSRRAIEEYMQKYLPVATEGRYKNVTVKDDLSFEVWSEEKKGLIAPEEHLSKGTIDQFYLVARFAVLNLLNKGTKSLLLLDDPFAGFDASRKQHVREILQDMTRVFQIIIFTHSSEYDGWGETIEI
ncbi:MAG: AAA family ATPase [Patescibacteria group bacterium]